MARAAIVLTLIAATLIGPSLCCCALARSLGHAAPATQFTQAPRATPACPNCRPPVRPAADHPGRPAPADPDHGCPHCNGRATVTAVAPTPAPQVLDLPFVALLPVVSDLPGAVEFAAVGGESPPGRGVRAFLLDTCHRLRC